MSYSVSNKNTEKKDRVKSAVLTLLFSALVFFLIYTYEFVRETPREEIITTMLINFGDNRNGAEAEEVISQDGSPAQEVFVTEELTQPQPEKAVEPPAQPEKIITGTSEKASVKKAVKAPTEKKESTKTPSKSTAKPAAASSTSKTTSGDGKGTAAIGNLIKGRGTKAGSQGTATAGNEGDPLGGEGNGDSKIGVDRKLVSYIPGTMGLGGQQPAHNCDASGTISIFYKVDKAGNVVSAGRSSGLSDPCVVTASVIWVKKYVKAERSNTSSTGTYKITF